MAGFVLLLLCLLLAARAWSMGRKAQPARIPRLLVRLGVAATATALLMAGAARTPSGVSAGLVIAGTFTALVTFDALTSLAMWGDFSKRAIWVRAPLAAIAIMLAPARGPWAAIAILGVASLLSFRWRSALSTRALFRAFIGSVALFAVLMAPFPGVTLEPHSRLHTLVTFLRLVLTMVRIYTLFGVFKSFVAFTRDPSLGIRTVSRRLALSHVLVLIVPLLITVVLWISTTWLGVNADRALAGRRLLESESAQLAAALHTAAGAGDGGAAAAKLARERAAHWPGVRLWVTRGDSLVRTVGDSIPGEARLVGWRAGLDTLPDHGVAGLRGRRWLGAAARSSAGTAILMVPIRAVLDSTVSPVLGARFAVREGSHADEDSVLARMGATPDSLRSIMRESESLQRELRGNRRNRPRVRRTNSAPSAPMVVNVGSETDSLGAVQAFGFGGMAILSGPECWAGRWHRSQYMLTARADLGPTMAGLYANVRENPLQAVPLVLLALIVLLLLPVAWVDFSMVGGMGRSIAQATGALSEGAAALGRGELGHRIEIKGQDDLWETARQFNRMAEGLERARELERERDRLESELELARRIQRRLLPEAPPEIPGLEIAGHSEPAREVGGDYFDHVDLGGGRALVVIADVSGKGVGAALLMSGFRASLMSQDAARLGPDLLASRTNDFLHRSVDPGKFVTAFFAILDGASGRLIYCNAGHNPPALRRADGRVEWLAAGGVVLGIMAQSRFESGEAAMAPGDLMVLYTDGVTEGAAASGEMWGETRLVESIERLAALPCAEAVESMVREVRAFEGDTGPADDITVLMVRRT